MAKEKPPGAGARVAVTLRLPQALYEELKREAKAKGMSVHEVMLLKLNPLSVKFE